MKSLTSVNTVSNAHMNKYSSSFDPKVKFTWDNQSIQWFLQSEKSTAFYKDTTEVLMPFIEGSKTILDVGCGVGSFSMEFAARGFDVTAMDISQIAVESLSNRARHKKLTNLKSLNIAFEDYDAKSCYDIVFISYMMGLVNENNIESILEKAKNHLILILPFNKIKNDFSIDELYIDLAIDIKNLEQINYLSIIDILIKKNIKYEIKKIKSEYGQLFNSFDEATQFVYHYFSIPKEDELFVTEWLNNKMIKLNGMYYLPSFKESSIIII